jgi:hypothetical protein
LFVAAEALFDRVLMAAAEGGEDELAGVGLAGGDGAPGAAAAAQGAAPPQQRAQGPVRTWVNIIQHLLVTSIQGRCDLHADNMFHFGANLTELIFSRCAPIQAVPSRFIVYESFKHSNDEVLPLRIMTSDRWWLFCARGC